MPDPTRWRAFALGLLLAACSPDGGGGAAEPAPAGADAAYGWTRLTPAAAFPGRYNFPVHVLPDGRFAALHPDGVWLSADGTSWSRSAPAPSGMNTPYLAYVQHRGATWALGAVAGDYRAFQIDPRIRRTADYRRWEEVGRSASLPPVVLYAAAGFRGWMWILGGQDAKGAKAAVWRSSDGLAWEEMRKPPWTARAGAKATVFRDRLLLIGGGEIDGPPLNDVWSTADGVEWRRESAGIADSAPTGYSAVAFDGKLWLVGANRSGAFTSEMLVSDDGRRWRPVGAPWSPRGAVAAWTSGDALYITGGKYSVERDGRQQFIYSNDVWRMRRR
ncbi:MAG TPA: hypothetical protein VFQ67_13495 [Allosphingosinicella sp.]|jgi:hypothetical protein|nr:hypothetical protein [Allosphingosinicella sp.]